MFNLYSFVPQHQDRVNRKERSQLSGDIVYVYK